MNETPSISALRTGNSISLSLNAGKYIVVYKLINTKHFSVKYSGGKTYLWKVIKSNHPSIKVGSTEEIHPNDVKAGLKSGMYKINEFIEEGKWSNIMKGVKGGSQTGPWTIVVIDRGTKRVIHQQLVKINKAIPAYYEEVKKRYPNKWDVIISIEDNEGKRVYSEAIKIKESIAAIAIGLVAGTILIKLIKMLAYKILKGIGANAKLDTSVLKEFVDRVIAAAIKAKPKDTDGVTLVDLKSRIFKLIDSKKVRTIADVAREINLATQT